MKALTLAAVIAALATPSLAAECMPKHEAFANMAGNGFEPTFIDKSSEYIFVLAEDGSGRWIMFAIVGDSVCPIVAGKAGEHILRKPNA